jgi:hypothetical protein
MRDGAANHIYNAFSRGKNLGANVGQAFSPANSAGSLRVHYDVRIIHGCSGPGATVIGIRTAFRVAFRMAGGLDGTGFGAIRSELVAFRAGAFIELHVPGFGGAGVPQPGYSVARFYMVFLVLFQHFSGVVNMELMQLLSKSLGGAKQ